MFYQGLNFFAGGSLSSSISPSSASHSDAHSFLSVSDMVDQVSPPKRMYMVN